MRGEVMFTELDEFLVEVDADRDEIARKIVRVTRVGRPVHSGAVTRVHVEAAYRVGGEIVRLRLFCGDLWGAPEDAKVQERASELVRDLEEKLLDRGLQLRAGVYEERRP